MSEALLLVGDSYTDPNMYYKTGFLAPDPFVYAELNGTSVVMISAMEKARAEKESRAEQVRSYDDYGYENLLKELDDRSEAFATVVARLMQDIGASGASVEESLGVGLADRLRSRGVEIKLASDLFQKARRSKSPEEVAAIEEAQRANERAAQQGIDILRASEVRGGMLHWNGAALTMDVLRSEIEVALLRAGMDTPTGTIVAGGPNAADPHWEGSGPLRADEAIVLDIFPRSKKSRYWADMTRTVLKGRPSETLQAIYDTVLRAQEAAFETIRAGVNAADVHAAVTKVFEDAGFAGEGSGPRLIHGTGHGVGLDIHEYPYISVFDLELLEGDVVTVEPGLYDPEVGGVRIEDMVLVTADGYRNLTRMPKQFVI